MVSIKHGTPAANRPGSGIGAAMWDEDHDVPLASQAEAESGSIDDKLLTPLTGKQLVDAVAGPTIDEVVEARGSRSTLNQRVSTIINLASTNAGGSVVVGSYYDNAFHGSAGGAISFVQNRIDLVPYYTPRPLRISQMGVAVSTGASGALGRVCIYGSGDNNWPDDLLLVGSNDLVCSSTGYKFHTVDFTFEAERKYWLGFWSSANPALRGIPITSSANLGSASATATSYFTVIRRVIPFGTSLPANWVFNPAERVANVVPVSVRMRAAALA